MLWSNSRLSPWLFAVCWLGLLLVPALLLMFVALGQWRVPVDAFVVGAMLPLLRGRVGPWLLWTGYHIVVGLFILRCFNIGIGNLLFYAEFAASIPPPKPELRIAAFVCALMPVLGAIFALPQRVNRRPVVILASFAIVSAGGLRMLSVSTPSLQYALPVPSLTMAAYYLMPLRTWAPFEAAAAVQTQTLGPLSLAIVEAPLPDQIYLHTIESWADNSDGLAQLVGFARRRFGDRLIEIKTGWRPSYGATLQGELRELCGIEGAISRLSGVPFRDCLPYRLRTLGYETVAGHGYQSMFYLRAGLYPRMGFQRSVFLDDIKSGVHSCSGVFPGLCDLALHNFLLEKSSTYHKRLVYQMTLQSHEPVSEDVLREYGITIAGNRSTAVAHAFVIGALDRLFAPKGADCGALIYFVGDHPPPSLKASGMFKDEVSYLLLRLAPSKRCGVL